MDINGYIPNNFDEDKMNAFKMLYLYRRKQEIFRQLLLEVDLTDPDDFRKKQPIIRSFEYLQQECGMTDEDLSHALGIGLWLDEYDEMINMNDQQRQKNPLTNLEFFSVDVSIIQKVCHRCFMDYSR